MFFQILGSIAEFDHALMSERALDGLAAARARGRTGGRTAKLPARQARIARDRYGETGPDGRRLHTVAHIAAEFGVTRPTVYRHLAHLPHETPPSR
jgi:DNA invertase Pin-like site-specific DNA recombinase